MAKSEMINGKPVSDDQIESWAAEAGAGFNVEALKTRSEVIREALARLAG